MRIIKNSAFIIITFWLVGCGDGITVSTGDNYDQIELPDNSIIYLNQNSSINYNKKFISREVNLRGEAFFAIESGDSPFVITTEIGTITVTGTEFNVKTTKKDLEIEVEQGAIELKKEGEKIINQVKKGERAILNASDKTIKFLEAEFKHEKWLISLEKEFNKLGREVKKKRKEFSKDLKKAGKEVGKNSKKFGKKLKKESKKLNK